MMEMKNPPIPTIELKKRKEYLEQHHDELPKGHLKKNTEDTLKEREKADDAFWNKNCGSLTGLEKYQKKFPNGKHISEIEQKRSQLEKQKIERNESIDNTLNTIMSIIKYGGMAIFIGLIILVIILSFVNDNKTYLAAIGPLGYSVYQLSEWEIKE